MSSWGRNLSPVTCLQDGHQETPAATAAAPQREPGDMCFSNTKNFPYPRRNGFCTDRPVLPIVAQKKESYMQSIWLHPKCFSTSQISLQIKNRAKINIGVRLNMNLRGKMTWMICLVTRQGNENSSMMLPKRCWLSIHNKAKSEQCFAVTSAKRVAVFQASWKVVREEAGAQLSTRITNAQHPRDQNIYEKEDAVNKNDALILKWQDD